MSACDRVRQVVEPLLAERGFELVDVVLAAGSTLRLTVDRPGGIDLDAVTEATQLVSGALDRADPIADRYLLEVSSPGIERTLRTPEHFRAAIGTTVAVKTRPGTEGQRRLEGVLEAAGDEGIVVAGNSVAYGDVERARTTFSWPAPTGRPRAKRGPARAGHKVRSR